MKKVITLIVLFQSTILLSQISAVSFAEKAEGFAKENAYDSAAHYYQMASEAYLAEKKMIEHFTMRIEAADQIYKKGGFDESSDLLLEIVQESTHLKEGNISFYAYQLLGQYNNSRRLFDPALKYFDLALNNFTLPKSHKSETVRAEIFSGMGRAYGDLQSLPLSKEYLVKAIDLYDSLGLVGLRVGLVNYNLFNVYSRMGFQLMADETLSKSTKMMIEALNDPDSPRLILNYLATGYNALLQHFDQRAIDYCNKALKISLTTAPRDVYTSLIRKYLADAYRNLGEYGKALQIQNEALEDNLSKYGANHPSIGEIYYQFGHHFNKVGDFPKAIDYYKKAAGIFQNLGNKTNYIEDLPQTWVYLGLNQMHNGEYETGSDNLRRGLRELEQGAAMGQFIMTNIYLTVADNFFSFNEPDSSLYYYQKALTSDSFNFKDFDFKKNPDIQSSGNIQSLFPLLIGKAKSLEKKYNRNKNEDVLHALRSTIISADTVAGILRTRPNIFNDKFGFQTQISEVNSLGINAAYELFQLTGNIKYLKSAFRYSEKNKANLTLIKLQENVFLKRTNIPDSIVNRIQGFQANISYMESQLADTVVQNDSSRFAQNENKLFELRSDQKEFLDEISRNYPKFHNVIYNSEIIEIQTIQEDLLSEDDLLISYHLDGSFLYTFQISKFDVGLTRIAIDSTFDQRLENFVQLHKTPNNSLEDMHHFSELGLSLRNILLPNDSTLAEFGSINIIPDNILALLPFETLVLSSGGTSFADLQYLIKSHDVRYAASATLLSRQKKEHKNFQDDGVLAFAPSIEILNSAAGQQVDTVRAGLATLVWTEDEVSDIGNFFETKSLLGKEATEKQFRKLSSRYPIVHVASHALLDEYSPMYSKLVFSNYDTDSINDGYLNTQEIFNMNIPAAMLVLSACNTGLGDVISGEGILSLASGFFYAGAKSLIMTLWTANDESTATIMNSFYQNLAQGENKSHALQNAKLTYLDGADELLAHPYYWAHFAVNGNNDPIVKNNKTWLYLILGMIVLTALIYQRKRTFQGAGVRP